MVMYNTQTDDSASRICPKCKNLYPSTKGYCVGCNCGLVINNEEIRSWRDNK